MFGLRCVVVYCVLVVRSVFVNCCMLRVCRWLMFVGCCVFVLRGGRPSFVVVRWRLSVVGCSVLCVVYWCALGVVCCLCIRCCCLLVAGCC